MRLVRQAVVLTGVVLALLAWSGNAEASFCGSSVARDFEAPLRSLPPENPLPKQLPFAPGIEASLGLRWGDDGRLLNSSQPFSLELRSETNVDLNWTVKMQVSHPSQDGSAGALVSLLSAGVSTVSAGVPVDLFQQALSPGTFRIEVDFFDAEGSLLGSYFEYVQVVPQTLKARIAVDRQVVAPGERLRVKIENLGTEPIGYGYFYALQRYDHGRWRQAPQVDHFYASLSNLPAGRAGRCQTVPIFETAEPGRYRILKKIRPQESRGSGERTLVKYFRVQNR
jgi:hypothetical protein